ncbi:MAG: 50S ribosomal protein L6 [Bacteroidales bacterium]|jgi:large subunit ribosomal protein L6|nr:50S ribosomal protein L6 [Bacteroidales bacterium]
MSRIGKLAITIPAGVTVAVDKANLVTVKGKLGELQQQIDPNITVTVEDSEINVDRSNESKDVRSKHGLYRSLISNMVQGVSEGFKTVQEFVGVGYKVDVQGQVLDMALGYSHHILFSLPPEVIAEAVVERGKNPKLIMRSHDKQLLGQVAAKIRSLRKPEPFKGKGVKFEGEILRKKAGKTAAK